jgi:hypothetical protein
MNMATVFEKKSLRKENVSFNSLEKTAIFSIFMQLNKTRLILIFIDVIQLRFGNEGRGAVTS